MSTYIDIHVIQTIPYANINRDLEGSPKNLLFGGAERTRVSSQSWKRAIRHEVEAALGEKSVRTRRLPEKVADALVTGHGWPEDLAKYAGIQVALSAAKGLKLEDGDSETSVLLYLPDTVHLELAELCVEHRAAIETEQTKKKGKGAAVLPGERVTKLIQGRTATINLFGRMLAEIPGSNVDGAVQVAHAFTTHESDSQRDFFTAVDDWNTASKDSGAGHMGTAEFSAGVFYRYATVNIDDLRKNLGADDPTAPELARLFLEYFITSMPQAKKNSTAPHTIPDLAHVVVREGRPVSGAAAFERPVRRAFEGGIGEPSVSAFVRYLGKVDELIGGEEKLFSSWAGVRDADDKELAALGANRRSFRELTGAAVERAFQAVEDRT
jgi:CRISPR system Cascade subunit CasC